MILLIDNYDSFTYNLYHYIIGAGASEVVVKRNDQITIAEIKNLNPKAVHIEQPLVLSLINNLITCFNG